MCIVHVTLQFSAPLWIKGVTTTASKLHFPPLIWRVRLLGICYMQYLRNMQYSEQEDLLFPSIFSPSGGFDSNNFVTVCYVSS